MVDDEVQFLTVGSVMIGRYAVHFVDDQFRKRKIGFLISLLPSPFVLGCLTNLVGLSLSSNQLTGEIPAELGGLTNLVVLSLSRNELTGEIPAELGNLSNLVILYLPRNQFAGCIPAGLRNTPDNDLAQVGLLFCGS